MMPSARPFSPSAAPARTPDRSRASATTRARASHAHSAGTPQPPSPRFSGEYRGRSFARSHVRTAALRRASRAQASTARPAAPITPAASRSQPATDLIAQHSYGTMREPGLCTGATDIGSALPGPTAASPYVQVLRTRERRERTGSPPPARPRRRKVAIAIARPAPARGQKQSCRAQTAHARIWARSSARSVRCSARGARRSGRPGWSLSVGAALVTDDRRRACQTDRSALQHRHLCHCAAWPCS